LAIDKRNKGIDNFTPWPTIAIGASIQVTPDELFVHAV
jgi:hypothetical protein